jgi:hypothetical protein
MSHDKISASARRRMAETGEPYAAARRAVIREHQAAGDQLPPPDAQPSEAPPSDAEWFEISYRSVGLDRVNGWLDTALFGGGPGRSGVEVSSAAIRLRGVGFPQDLPQAAVRSVARSQFRTRGTSGVHEVSRGRWLVNNGPDGLVEVVVEPLCYTGRNLSTGFMKRPVHSLILGLVDPDGFIAAVQRHIS